MSQYLSSAAVVIGTLRVRSDQVSNLQSHNFNTESSAVLEEQYGKGYLFLGNKELTA